MIKRNNKTILVVDDEYGARESMKIILEDDYEILTAQNYSQAFDMVLHHSIDIILLDICMPGKTGLEFLKDIRKKNYLMPVVMVTATKTLKTAVEAMKQGASDYLTKPFDVEEIRALVRENLAEPVHTQKKSASKFSRKDIIGNQTTLKTVFKLIDRLATTDSTVLILGASGTGKELIAREIHQVSSRNKNHFIPVHLSAISENLIESELFGHMKGSFTGADKDRKGAFEMGDKGTIFLDEIGEISENVQIKLLRVIQEKEFKPVGETHPKKTDIRIIAATNKDLYSMVGKGEFRADLYYRLNVVPVLLPPLKDRLEDIHLLCDYLIEKVSHRLNMTSPVLDESVINVFLNYDWPGNIRELENILEHMILMADREVLTANDLPSSLRAGYDENIENDEELETIIDNENVFSSLERETIQVALLRNNGVLTSTAKCLGTTRRILKYKMDKLGIEKTDLFRN